MKNIKYIILLCLFSISFVNAQTPTANLSVTCNSSNLVNYAINTTNYSGNLTVSVEYDPTKLNTPILNGSVAGVSRGNPTILPNGNNQVDITVVSDIGSFNQSFGINFYPNCSGQTCFGRDVATIIKSTLTGNGIQPVVKICTKTLQNNNDITGTLGHYDYTRIMFYNCVDNSITMYLKVQGASCFSLQNGKITLTPNVSVLATEVTEISNCTSSQFITSNSNQFDIGDLNFNCFRTFKLTFKLNCDIKYPFIFKVNAQLGGKNCNTFVPNIYTFPEAVFPLPNNLTGISNTNITYLLNNTNISYNSSTLEYTAKIQLQNSGQTIANLNVTTIFPNKKIIRIEKTTSTPSTATANMELYACGNNPSPIATYNSFPQNISSSISKSITQVNNLGIGETISFNYIFIDNTGCQGNSNSLNFETSYSYQGVNSLSCNCVIGNGIGSYTSTYTPPNAKFSCSLMEFSKKDCPKEGDLEKLCSTIRNSGMSDLHNPTIEIPVSPYLTLNSIEFQGLVTPFVLNPQGTHYVINPNIALEKSTTYNICYNIQYKAQIPEGSHSAYTNFNIKGNLNTSSGELKEYVCEERCYNCGIAFTICGDGKPTLVKEVYDNISETFKENGSGQAGTPTRYRFTIKNIAGNRPIKNFKIVDRLPHIGDKMYTNCAPRNSQYNITATGVITPNTIPLNYTNSGIGSISLPSSFVGIDNLSVSCTNNSAVVTSIIDNTLVIEYPSTINPYSEESFEIVVNIPANATKGQVACNTATYSFDYLTNGSTSSLYGGINESTPPVCYTILPLPCKNCPEILKSSKLIMNEEVENVPNQDFVVTTGVLTFTTIKPIQEIHLSVADLVYTFDKEGCTDCKTPAMARGCLFPTSTTHQIGTNATTGYLKFEEIDPNHLYGNPNSMNDQQCSEELSWGLGVMLKPGTYQIPFTLTLPKSVIPECCKLEIEKFNVKLSLKDADCMVCENIISPNTDNCCTGGSWASKYIQSPNPRFEEGWLTEDYNTIPQARIAKMSYEEKNIRKAISFNKSKLDKGEEAEMAQVFWAPQRINCGEKIFLKEGETKIFAAAYNCNTSMERCNGEVKISIKKIIGNYDINVDNRASGFRQQFPSAGEYKVTYTPYCGGRPCGEPCVFTIIVKKDCCATVKKNGATKVTSYRLGGIRNAQTLLVTDLTSNSQSISSNNIVDVKLNYSCPTGCTPSYQWQRIRNGVVIETQIATSATFQINTPSEGRIKDKIRITVKCGETLCESVYEEFELSCNNCLLGSANPPFPGGGVVSPNNPTGSIYTESYTMSPNVGNVENLQEDTCQGGIWTEKRYRTYVVNGIETRGSGEISFDVWPNYIELIKADYGFQPCVKFKCNNNQMATDFKIIKKNLTTNTETICSSLYSPLGNNDSCWKFVAQGIQGTSIFKCLIPENTVNRYTIIPICNGTPCEDAKFVFDLVKKK